MATAKVQVQDSQRLVDEQAAIQQRMLQVSQENEAERSFLEEKQAQTMKALYAKLRAAYEGTFGTM